MIQSLFLFVIRGPKVMEIWQTIVLAVTGNMLAISALGWLAQRLIITGLDRAAAVQKHQLRIDADKQVTELKDRLEKVAMEHQVRFTKLHEKRAEVLAELYRLMAVGLAGVHSFISPIQLGGDPTQQQKFVVAMNNQADFFTYLDQNKIYLPRNISNELETFFRDIRSMTVGVGIYTQIPDDQLQDHTRAHMMNNWIKAAEKLEQEVPKARAVLEDEFRRLLGDSLST